MQKYVWSTLASLVVLGIGILALGRLGQVFIKEVIQEVPVEERKGLAATTGIDSRAPLFELSDLSGKTVKLPDFFGAPLIITFWATWNAASTDQIKILDDYLAKNNEKLFKIVSINSQEDRSVVSSFILRGGYRVKILLDESGAAGESYGVRNLPATFLVDKEGTIREVFIGILNEEMLLNMAEKIL